MVRPVRSVRARQLISNIRGCSDAAGMHICKRTILSLPSILSSGAPSRPRAFWRHRAVDYRRSTPPKGRSRRSLTRLGIMAAPSPDFSLLPSSLSDSELSDDVRKGSSPTLRPRRSPEGADRLFHLSSAGPSVFKPIHDLEKRFLTHERDRHAAQEAALEEVPDATAATHTPPYIAGGPRSVPFSLMASVDSMRTPRRTCMVDVSGDLVASATDNFVEVRSISTGRAVREFYVYWLLVLAKPP